MEYVLVSCGDEERFSFSIFFQDIFEMKMFIIKVSKKKERSNLPQFLLPLVC